MVRSAVSWLGQYKKVAGIVAGASGLLTLLGYSVLSPQQRFKEQELRITAIELRIDSQNDLQRQNNELLKSLARGYCLEHLLQITQRMGLPCKELLGQ